MEAFITIISARMKRVAYYRLCPPHLRLRLVFLLITGLLDNNTKLTGRPAGL